MKPITNRSPLISVIIDSYNYGRFIEEAIDSVLNQTFPAGDMEIIVVDDGSTDDTQARIKKYKDKIKYIYKSNRGQASALNAGFENAKGEIIAFLDSDDYWHPQKISSIAEIFEGPAKVDFIYHNLNVIDANRNLIKPYYYYHRNNDVMIKDIDIDDYLKGRIILNVPMSGISVRVEYLMNLMPIPESYSICADAYLHFFLPFYAKTFAFIWAPLGSYRIHGNNLFEGNAGKVSTEIETYKMLAGHIKGYAADHNYDASWLINEIGFSIRCMDDLRDEKKISFSIITSVLKTHRKLLRDAGLKIYFSLFFEYRKAQALRLFERIKNSVTKCIEILRS